MLVEVVRFPKPRAPGSGATEETGLPNKLEVVTAVAVFDNKPPIGFSATVVVVVVADTGATVVIIVDVPPKLKFGIAVLVAADGVAVTAPKLKFPLADAVEVPKVELPKPNPVAGLNKKNINFY